MWRTTTGLVERGAELVGVAGGIVGRDLEPNHLDGKAAADAPDLHVAHLSWPLVNSVATAICGGANAGLPAARPHGRLRSIALGF
jgi:hypothetical protein